MPWEGIQDAEAEVPLIWLSRIQNKELDQWTPLRKSDCKALSDAYNSKKEKVYIDGGRATADLSEMTITYHFYDYPARNLCYASWFVIVKNNPKTLIPLHSEDTPKIEAMYQKAVKALSTYGDGRQAIVNEEVILSDNEQKFKAVLTLNGEIASLRRRPVSWLGGLGFTENSLIQRGYGSYTIDGEEEEVALGPLKHCVFIVHGIGEAMWSRTDVNTPSLVEEVDILRKTINKRLYESYKKACQKAAKTSENQPPPPNRIEFLPIQWYETIHGSSSSVKQSVSSVTLKTIPLMRSLANDVVFDVMMYLTPEFCRETLEFVTRHINDDLKKLMDVHLGFDPLSKQGIEEGYRCSLIGHSLGSVIVWDILSTLKVDLDLEESVVVNNEESSSSSVGYSSFSKMKLFDLSCLNMPTLPGAIKEKDDDGEKNKRRDVPLWGPIVPSALQEKLMFVPEYVLFLGSPIGLFLSLRGAQGSFTKYSTLSSEDNDGFVSRFTLPVSSALYNIFHPSDPVAYRIEPLLLPPGFEPNLIPSPCFLTTEEGGMTLHTRFTQFGLGMQKTFSQKAGIKSPDGTDAVTRQASSFQSDEYKFALGGSNKNVRVDYQLQQGLIGNDYISSLIAHTSYFRNEDVISFIMELNSICGHSGSDD